MDASKIEKHLIAYGRVQGVGYRATVADLARSLSLLGSVRNLDDGTVEIYVQGEKENVGAFLKLIVEDVYPASVERIAEETLSSHHIYDRFKILF
jgi:acylphosphatase